MKKCILYYSVIALTLTNNNSCQGMMAALGGAAPYLIPTAIPLALYAFFAIRHRVNTNGQIAKLQKETDQNFEKTQNKIEESRKQISQQVEEKNQALGAKIDTTKNEILQKIEEAKNSLEDLITKKIDTSEAHILAHVGMTKFDILKDINEVKENLGIIQAYFEKKLDTMGQSLQNCAKLEDVRNLEKIFKKTLQDMHTMLADSQEEQKKFFKEQLRQQDMRAEKRFERLQKDNIEIKKELAQIKVLLSQKKKDKTKVVKKKR